MVVKMISVYAKIDILKQVLKVMLAGAHGISHAGVMKL